MRAGPGLAATVLVVSPAFAANGEWPSGPKNEFFRALGRGWGKGQTRASRVNRDRASPVASGRAANEAFPRKRRPSLKRCCY
jgi:hypothetical protein